MMGLEEEGEKRRDETRPGGITWRRLLLLRADGRDARAGAGGDG